MRQRSPKIPSISWRSERAKGRGISHIKNARPNKAPETEEAKGETRRRCRGAMGEICGAEDRQYGTDSKDRDTRYAPSKSGSGDSRGHGNTSAVRRSGHSLYCCAR